MLPATNRLHRLFFLTSLLTVGAALLTTGCLWGVVRDADTGDPIGGATVSYTDSNGNTGSTTTGANGLYSFDQAVGPYPALGAVSFQISAPGYETLTNACLAEYNDANGNLANLSSFWEVQSFSLTPSGMPATTADVAVTDLYPDNQPAGTLWARITNNGPDSLVNASLQISCEATRNDTAVCHRETLGPINVSDTVNLDPGQTANVNTAMGLDTSKYWYEATCTVQTLQDSYSDSNPVNDSYTEIIPPPTGDLELQDILLNSTTNEVGIRIQASGTTGNQFQWTVAIGGHEYPYVSYMPAGSQVTWTGYLVAGTEIVSASLTPCASPETNVWNDQLVKTCSSASHTCW